MPRPNPREISLNLLRSGQVVTNDAFNTLLMQWGQFVSHDIVKTSLMPHDLCNGGSCRDGTGKCANIPVNPFDPNAGRFPCDAQGCCVKTPRAAAVCGTGFSNPREQLNENTAFIDGSMIYGSSVVDSRNFRAGNTGFLRMEFFDSGRFLPVDQRRECPHSGACIKAKFQAGDDRANVFLGLAAMHNLFAREHNRLVEALQLINPHWMGDTLYQEARKIVSAELQAITYKEWLPKILSQKQYETRFANFTKYNSSVNPSITSEFSGAAFRFGHGMIPEFFQRIDAQGFPIPQGGVRFLDGLLKSEKLISEGGLDPLLRGLMLLQVKKPQRFSISPTDLLFGNQDLAAMNIQRGRDLGIQTYNTLREFCGIGRAVNFQNFSSVILDPGVVDGLGQMYGHPGQLRINLLY